MRRLVMSGWPFWVAGAVLGLINAMVIYLTGHPISIVAALIAPSRETILMIGIFAGALASTLLMNEFRLSVPSRLKTVLAALIGGLVMGYGARIALGCNVSGAIGGITSFSLHGWAYLVAMLAGTWVGSFILKKYLM